MKLRKASQCWHYIILHLLEKYSLMETSGYHTVALYGIDALLSVNQSVYEKLTVFVSPAHDLLCSVGQFSDLRAEHQIFHPLRQLLLLQVISAKWLSHPGNIRCTSSRNSAWGQLWPQARQSYWISTRRVFMRRTQKKGSKHGPLSWIPCIGPKWERKKRPGSSVIISIDSDVIIWTLPTGLINTMLRH